MARPSEVFCGNPGPRAASRKSGRSAGGLPARLDHSRNVHPAAISFSKLLDEGGGGYDLFRAFLQSKDDMKPTFVVTRGLPRARMSLALVAILALSALPSAVRAGGVVTSCTEAALRAALAGGGTVTMACDGTIVLTNTLVITNHTTLTATGYDLTLSGNNAVRLFWVNSNVNLTLVNLKLADGYALGTKGAYGLMGALGRGGAILNNGGILQASDCTFLHNRAEGGQGGDGRSAIGDVVLPGMGGRGQGGAICNLSGQVFLTNSVLNGNQVDGGRGGFSDGGYSGNGGDGMGGAVYSSGGFLALSGCLLTTNAMLPGPPGYTTFKSGINGSSAGGAVYLEGTDGLILTSRFEQNVGGGGGRGGSTLGGAVFQTGGRLELSGSLFASNRVSGGAAYQISGAPGLGGAGIGGGGALYLAGFAGITNCAIVSNQAEGGPYGQGGTLGDGKGGGIYSAGSLSAVNCTIANNSALGGATPGEGGSAFGGGIYGPALLNSVTLAENSALKRGGSLAVITVAQGGGIYGSATLRNSLLAGNWYNARTNLTLEPNNYWGSPTDEGQNLSSDASVALNAAGSMTNTDPKLGLLGNFGGPTPTIPLLGGSPAIDAGNPAWCPPTDQRGVARPVGAGCDIGAFEGSIPNYPQLAMVFTPATAVTGAVVVLTYTISNPNTNALSKVSFANTLPPELRVAPVPGLVNSCGSGAINAVAGGGLVTVTNVALAANQTCSFAVNVVGPAPGLVTNTVGPVSSAETGPGAAIASAVLSLASSITGPSVVTGPASNVQEHSATLTGTANPNGAATTAWFEYGPTASYGSMSSIINLGGGYVAANVTADLANLPTKSVLHYRLVAQNIAGTIYGADQVFSALTYGVTNFALQFDGVDDRVQIGQGGGMDGLTQGTIELWVRWNGVQPTDSTYGQHGAVFSRNGSNGRQAILALDNSNPALAHVTWSPFNTTRALTGQRFVGDGVWHHVAVTFAPGAQRLYLDGVLEASGTQNGVLGTDPSGYVSLANLGNTATFARCTLDEVRVWSMARNDIAYNMRRPLDSATPGLIGYWRLDEGTGVIAHDVTGHGYDGTLFNGPLWVRPTNTVAYGMYVTSSKLGNQLRLTLTGQPDQSFVLQRSSDLLNWSGVLTNVLGANGQYLYTEPNINTAPQRLYRLRTP